jgi:hypothetical protein
MRLNFASHFRRGDGNKAGLEALQWIANQSGKWNYFRVARDPGKIADGRALLVYNTRHLRLGVRA